MSNGIIYTRSGVLVVPVKNPVEVRHARTNDVLYTDKGYLVAPVGRRTVVIAPPPPPPPGTYNYGSLVPVLFGDF